MGTCISNHRKPVLEETSLQGKIILALNVQKKSNFHMKVFEELSKKYSQQPLLLHPMVNPLYASHIQKNKSKQLES